MWTLTELVVTAPSYAPYPAPGHPFYEYRSMGGGGRITLAENTMNWDRVVNHELGHVLGLNHPGYGIDGIQANELPEYEYTGKDINGNDVNGKRELMGTGTGMRGFYYMKWEEYLKNQLDSCSKKHKCKYVVTDK